MTPHNGYGPYGGMPDPYGAQPENACDLYESMLDGQTAAKAMEMAENPQYQQMTDAYGRPVYWADGTPMMERIPMEQRMAPFIRRQMERRTRMRLLRAAIPMLIILGLAVLMTLPESIRWLVIDDVLPIIARVCVWGGVLGAVVFTLIKALGKIGRK